MLGEIFYWIFNMSITASLMGLIVLLLRRIRKIPRRVTILLWLVPYIRMTVPIGLGSRYSLMTLISHFTSKTVPVYQSASKWELSVINFLGAAKDYSPLEFKTKALEKVFEVCGIVWLALSLMILAGLTALYVTTIREMRHAENLYENVFLSEKARETAVYGILRPRIVLSEIYEETAMKHVLRHERTHIRRLDNLWRMVAFLITVAHWFDPFAWIFLKAFLSDIELACDEAVVARYSSEERQQYAETLLCITEKQSLFAAGFGGVGLKTRIRNLFSFRPITFFSALCFIAMIGVVLLTLLTNAV